MVRIYNREFMDSQIIHLANSLGYSIFLSYLNDNSVALVTDVSMPELEREYDNAIIVSKDLDLQERREIILKVLIDCLRNKE